MVCSLTFCQTVSKTFPVLNGAYLGQNPPGNKPEVFAPGIISTETGYEAGISFSKDMTELFYFSRKSIEGMENRIMQMKMVRNVWSQPEPPSFALDLVEYEAFITPDNLRVFFKSQRPKPAGSSGNGGIWYSGRENDDWGDPVYLPGVINDGWVMSVTSTLEGTLYFTGSYDSGYGLYRAEFRNGTYSKPEYLPVEINKSKYFGASHPFIDPDESFLIFDANGAKNSDLFISFRKNDGGWTDAVPLGPEINTPGYEGIATVSPDGKYLFFNRDNDIYWVSAQVIERLKPKEL